jgi:CheY-like chemotaxis protein
MRETLVALLTMESIDTLTAINGEEALLLIYQHKPKLVLLDMQLPGGISGLDVLKTIRCNPAYAGIRVILHTSEPHAPSLPEAQAADLVVLKPANPDDLLTFIYRLF